MRVTVESHGHQEFMSWPVKLENEQRSETDERNYEVMRVKTYHNACGIL